MCHPVFVWKKRNTSQLSKTTPGGVSVAASKVGDIMGRINVAPGSVGDLPGSRNRMWKEGMPWRNEHT